MAGFKTHITTSTIVGIGYGTAGHLLLDLSRPASIISAGLCSIAGMLPDVDSDSGKPVQEVMGFAAATVPLLLLEHLRQQGLDGDALVAAGVCAYMLVRFGIGSLLRRCTVHRGMWHSLPALAIAALVTAFIFLHDPPLERWFKVGAVSLGFLVHLTLDEIWSIEWNRGRVRLKKSSGTAIKIWSDNIWANLFVFANLALLSYLLLNHSVGHGVTAGGDDLFPSPPREASQRSFEADSDWMDRR